MCHEDVRAFVEDLRTEDLSRFAKGCGRAITDGFGVRKRSGNAASELFEEICDEGGKRFPVVTRLLESTGYNLPDAAVYQRLCFDSPGVALGWVKPNAGDPPNRDIRGRWQGLMWHVYDVAFVDVVNGKVKEFCPEEDWGIGEPPPQLANIVADLQEPLEQARRDGCIPVYTQKHPNGDSKATEPLVQEILTCVLREYGYQFAGSHTRVPAFWWGTGHQLDLLYRSPSQGTIAIEVKVNEDWDHPICEPLGDLMGHNGVINIRVPPELDKLECKDKKLIHSPAWGLVKKAQRKLKDTDRAGFVYVWPEGAEPKV